MPHKWASDARRRDHPPEIARMVQQQQSSTSGGCSVN
jgi:hypothetical protein